MALKNIEVGVSGAIRKEDEAANGKERKRM